MIGGNVGKKQQTGRGPGGPRRKGGGGGVYQSAQDARPEGEGTCHAGEGRCTLSLKPFPLPSFCSLHKPSFLFPPPRHHLRSMAVVTLRAVRRPRTKHRKVPVPTTREKTLDTARAIDVLCLHVCVCVCVYIYICTSDKP